jgi:hypothetical protein
MILTDRDRALLGYVGVARYVTAPQAHRLLAPDSDKAVTSRRLARLCEDASGPDGEAYLVRHEYRRANSLPFPGWALPPHGRDTASPFAPGPVASFLTTAAIGFVLRVLMVNELLLALVLAGRRSPASPLPGLPFRWRGVTDPLRFEIRNDGQDSRPAVLRPAAIIDLLRERRRIFVEPELGLATLSPADPRRKHVIRRVERYAAYFMRSPPKEVKRTWYAHAFPDDYTPEVLLLSRSESRRAQVEASVREHFRARDLHFDARALTMSGAIAALTPHVSAVTAPARVAAPAPVPPRPSGRTVVIDDALAHRIRSGLNLFVETYRSMRKQASVHSETCPSRFALAPQPTDQLNAFYRLMNEVVLGAPPVGPREGGS